MTSDIRELELHYEEVRPRNGTERKMIPADDMSDAIRWRDRQLKLVADYPGLYEFRNFRLYEYTSEHGLREIPIPESGGES